MYIWLETTFETAQKWSLRPLLDSPKGGLNIGILLYLYQEYKVYNKGFFHYLHIYTMIASVNFTQNKEN